jgi:hypothetical protein
LGCTNSSFFIQANHGRSSSSEPAANPVAGCDLRVDEKFKPLMDMISLMAGLFWQFRYIQWYITMPQATLDLF